MVKRLDGNVAIITGGGQGVGYGIAQGLAAEGANLVLTGCAARSPASEQFFADHPDMEDAYLNQIALGRLGDAATDIASAVVFLASAESGYITGQTINVDGGQAML